MASQLFDWEYECPELNDKEHRLLVYRLASGFYAVSCSAGDLGQECKTREEAEGVAFGHVLLMLEMQEMSETETPEPPEPAPEPPPAEQVHEGATEEEGGDATQPRPDMEP